MEAAEHVRQAELLLDHADNVRNVDRYTGDRDAASTALAQMAHAHATVAVAIQLTTRSIGVFNSSAV